MNQASDQRVVNELEGPIRGKISEARELLGHGENGEAVDAVLIEADGRVAELARTLGVPHLYEKALPVEVLEGQVYMDPPILFSVGRPAGVPLEALLEQVIGELEGPDHSGSRERSLVITKLEEALHWERRHDEIAGPDEPRKV